MFLFGQMKSQRHFHPDEALDVLTNLVLTANHERLVLPPQVVSSYWTENYETVANRKWGDKPVAVSRKPDKGSEKSLKWKVRTPKKVRSLVGSGSR